MPFQRDGLRVCGRIDPSWTARLLDLPVKPVALHMVSALANDPGAFVAAIGAAISASEYWPIDFLNPKKPVVRRDRRKPIAALGH